MRIKILGAGSIGNHMAHAARRLDWSVTLVDPDPGALARTRESIYPGRYGTWDESITLTTPENAPTGDFDLIVVGTPPDHHMAVALAALKEAPRAILVEKPLCTPDLAGAAELQDAAARGAIPVFVGYDHVVGAAARAAVDAMKAGAIGELVTLDVEFREHWGGIFAAHPWLDGPQDTYLGYWRRGGGASGEHSHAANLWQHLAHAADGGRVQSVTATLDYVTDQGVEYDRLCMLCLQTESGLLGRVVQDVVTRPSRKWARLQGTSGFLEWHCGFDGNGDAVIRSGGNGLPETNLFRKTRPDDFIAELRHIAAALEAGTAAPDISLTRGLETMLVIAAAHESARTGRRVFIDYSAGWSLLSLHSE